MKVDLMIVGAQKCATTTLFSLLNKHPQLCGSAIKETNFFSFSPDWQLNLNAYHAGFKQAPGVMYFEASPTYTFPNITELPGASTAKMRSSNPVKKGSFRPIPNERVWDDIHAYNPALKIIYLVRNPLDRIVSGYMHYYARGYTDLSIEEELKTNGLHVAVSCYASRIQPFTDRFGSKQVLIIQFDDLLGARAATLQRVATFLGINPEPFAQVEAIEENTTVGQAKLPVKWDVPNIFWIAVRKLAPKLWRQYASKDERVFHERPLLPAPLKHALLARLEPETLALEAMLGTDLGHWRR